MRNSLLSQILGQGARARCKCSNLNYVLLATSAYDVFWVHCALSKLSYHVSCARLEIKPGFHMSGKSQTIGDLAVS